MSLPATAGSCAPSTACGRLRFVLDAERDVGLDQTDERLLDVRRGLVVG